MLVTAALALAAAISPVTVTVTTADGSSRAVHVADADALPVQACARDAHRPDAVVCAPVVASRGGLQASIDVTDTVDTRYALRVERFDARSDSLSAVAIGFGVAAGASLAGAVVAGSVAVGVMGSSEQLAGATAATSLGLLAVTGASTVAAVSLAAVQLTGPRSAG
jgi:hypothetical protein